jgi:hypothetical protein
MLLRRFFTLLFAVSFVLAPTSSPAQALHAADLAGTLAALSQLRASLDAVINTGDTEADARISQIKISLDGVIAELNKTIKLGFDGAQITEQKLFSDINDVTAQTNDALDRRAISPTSG